MTQITRKSVPMRGLILLLTVTLGAGLVLSGCGDDDTATTPAPAPPPPPPPPAPEPEPEPEPPAPEAPATPTGLMVSETTETSITWTWDAVEGATGYVVQANTDEMWDATDTVTFEGLPFTTETTYTAMDLEPETSGVCPGRRRRREPRGPAGERFHDPRERDVSDAAAGARAGAGGPGPDHGDLLA